MSVSISTEQIELPAPPPPGDSAAAGNCSRSSAGAAGCAAHQIILCQISLLALGLVGLGSAGLGIDYLHARLDPSALGVRWPFGLAPPASWAPMTVLLVIAAVVILSALLRGALTWLSGALLARLVHRRVIADLQTTVFAKLQYLHFRFFDEHSRGEIINRATGDIASIRAFVDTVLIQALTTVLTVVVYLVYMVNIHVGLTFACLSLLPLMLFGCVRYSHAVHPLYLRNRSLFDRMVLTLAESIEGVAVIKGFAREPEVAARFRGDNAAVKDQQRRIFWRMSLFTPAIDFFTQFSLVTLLLYGGKLVIAGKLPLGTGLVVFAGLLQQFANQVTTIAQIANGIQESLTGARRVFDILDAPAGLPVPIIRSCPRFRPTAGTVAFEKVFLSPCRRGSPALNGVSIDVAPGECIAVVGETGAGKSALLSLIPRFYDSTAGRVLVDGVDVRDWDLQALRRRVGHRLSGKIFSSATRSPPTSRLASPTPHRRRSKPRPKPRARTNSSRPCLRAMKPCLAKAGWICRAASASD